MFRSAGAWCYLVLLSAAADAMVLLGGRTKASDSRYFTVEQMLPPLQACASTCASNNNNSTTSLAIPYSEQQRIPPRAAKEIPVVYTNDPKQVSQWLCNHVPSSGGTLGFDVESVPDAPWMKKTASFIGPATVQLATVDASIVVHLTRRNGRSRSRACAPILEAVLSDSSIIKAGTGIDDDLLELYITWQGLQARSRLDLGGIAGSRQPVGLQRLTKSILGVDLQKSRRQAMSDWSQVPLTDTQLRYSARDAWAGAAICAELCKLDPQTFGTKAMVDRLQHEHSLKELHHHRQTRKQAKTQLTQLLAPYVQQKQNGGRRRRAAMRMAHHLDDHDVPPTVQRRVARLKRTLRETPTQQHRLVFDVAPLGIEIQ